MTNGSRRGWGVSITPRPLFTPGKDQVAILQEAGWAPGPVWTGAKNLASTGIRSPDRPTSGQSLYRLSYPGISCRPYSVIGRTQNSTIFGTYKLKQTRDAIAQMWLNSRSQPVFGFYQNLLAASSTVFVRSTPLLEEKEASFQAKIITCMYMLVL